MIATGTLALGINAPARTTVFCDDSPFLTALMVGRTSTIIFILAYPCTSTVNALDEQAVEVTTYWVR